MRTQDNEHSDMPRIVTTPPSTSIPTAFEPTQPTFESPAAPDNIDGIASSPASHSSSQATAATTMDRSHEEAMETSVDHDHTRIQQQSASCQTAHCRFTEQKINSLPLNEEILLYVRYMKNFVCYSDLSLELSKVQSSAMDYCCRLWMDFSRLAGYSYTDTTT